MLFFVNGVPKISGCVLDVVVSRQFLRDGRRWLVWCGEEELVGDEEVGEKMLDASSLTDCR